MKNFYDVIIVGGGASGLACAISFKSKNKNAKVCIIERNNKIGKKLLTTGSGRCNLTNANIKKENYLGSFDPDYIINTVNTQNLIEFFNSLGLLCKEERFGLYYPYSKQSSSVLEVLRLAVTKNNIEIITECDVTLIKKKDKLFSVKTTGGFLECKNIVLCCGGKASPSCGGYGGGLDLCRNLGHKISPVSPALCPVEVTKNIKNLKGVRSAGKVTLLDDGKEIKSETGEIQFTDKTLSGICVFNLSSHINACKKPVIKISLMNDYSQKEIYNMLFDRKEIFKDENVQALLSGIFNFKLSNAILKECKISPLSRKCSSLTDEEIKKLAFTIKNWCFECRKVSDFSKAQVMAGGVYGKEINNKTMESKIVKGLYICGELIDINGDCGGYNLHFAFASGIIAGESI